MAFTLKFPPPPDLAQKDPSFNRWLIEFQNILTSEGNIDPSSVVGLLALEATVATNVTSIATLNSEVSTINGQITTLQGQVSTLQGQVSTLNSQVAALQARAQVFQGTGAPSAGLGNTNDWYADVPGTSGHHIYVKTAPGTWTFIV